MKSELATGPVAIDHEAPHNRRVRQVELFISNLLRIGVISSLFVIAFGTTMTFRHHPAYLSSPAELRRLTRPGASFPRTPHDVAEGLNAFQGRAIVVVGLLMLVATPVLRVAVSIVAFAYERDRLYVLITATVLALLILSFVLGKAEG